MTNDIYLNLFIVSVDLKSTKKYILSCSDKDIVVPRVPLKQFNKAKLKHELSEYIRYIIPMNILGIIPQIINLHSQLLSNTYKRLDKYDIKDVDIESVYGCLVDHIEPSNKNYFWIEFAYEIPNDYSANIFEVCQYLQ